MLVVDVLLFSPFVSLTIAKYIRLCELSFVVLFSAMYVHHFRICNINLTILRNYSGIGHTCASSRNQAPFFSYEARLGLGYEARLGLRLRCHCVMVRLVLGLGLNSFP